MRVRLLGTRGSYPISNPRSAHYGGSTPCVEVSAEGETLILDAGTGIVSSHYEKGQQTGVYHILLTHLHMDHIQGLGFFNPIFVPGNHVHIWGPGSSTESLLDRLKRFLSPPLFPVSIRDVGSNLHIHELSNSDFNLGCFHITTAFVCHPGPTIGYRIENSNKSLVYIPDHEPVIGRDELFEDVNWISGYDLAKSADLLIHDAQYSLNEYHNRIGWGHSSIYHAAQFAQKTSVKRLLLFHHDPTHTDSMMDEILKEFLDHHELPLQIELAVEGTEIEL